jgi:hypothetical protein
MTCGVRNPVAWTNLRQAPVVARGPAPDGLSIWADQARLRTWVRENAQSYWRARWRKSRRFGAPAWWISRSDWFVEWCVLGVARLHYTDRTGRIASKTAAGAYARDAFDAQWRDLIDAALAIRQGAPHRAYAPDRRARTLAFMDVALEDLGA